MPQSFTSTDGGTFYIPGAYSSFSVAQSNSGLPTTGVLMLVGESDQGPDFSLEADIGNNFFGPTQANAVKAKYGSGPLVDVYNAAIKASNDDRITGSLSSVYLVKTNVSTTANGNLLRSGLSNYATVVNKGYGQAGNLINTVVTAATAEIVPTTGPFTYIPGPNLGSADGSIVALRNDGSTKQTLAIARQASPTTLVGSITTGSATGLNSLSGILATGGVDQAVLATKGSGITLAVVATGTSILITLGTGSWTTTPVVGSTLIIPAASTYGKNGTDSVIKGAGSANLGAYIVTAATANTITATKLRDAATTGVAAPINVTAVALGGGTDDKDIICYTPITVTQQVGTDRGLLNSALMTHTVAGTVVGQSLKLTLETGQQWVALPQVGDWLFLPSTGPANISQNGGWYVVTAATTGVGAGGSTITATSLNNSTPIAFSATALVATTDIQCIRPVVDGTAKALEIYDGAGNINVNTLFFTVTGTAVTWISTGTTPYLLTSSSEYSASLTDSRQFDGISETQTAGGTVGLNIGYSGTTATATITSTMLTTTVTGGNGANLSIVLKNFNTLSDLAAFINAQTGYLCTLSTTLVGQYPVVNNITVGSTTTQYSVLDTGTFGICSEIGTKPGRIKLDGYSFWKVMGNSFLLQLGASSTQPAAGLPEVQPMFYLGGGARGATTAAKVVAAIDACAKLRGNFLIPLFSQDASADIALGLTDAASTYTIDAINAYAKSHCLLMSQIKRARNRQAFLSKRDSFANVKTAANNLASSRCSMTFLDHKVVDSTGVIKQFQPFMGAGLAAGLQAAAGYKGIVLKLVNTSGVVMADGSFDPNNQDQVEDALKNGLMVTRVPNDGVGLEFVSDQTTYGSDANFVYNSIQAVYIADTVALTLKQRMGKAFAGLDLADVSASVSLAYLQGIMVDLKRLKLITASDDAPAGWKNAVIKIQGNAMLVSLEVKLNSLLYFIKIDFLVTQVSQTASAAA